jgi:hypothetical protein
VNTALANNQGEIVIPATVTGTLQHPVFGPKCRLCRRRKGFLLVLDTRPRGFGLFQHVEHMFVSGENR